MKVKSLTSTSGKELVTFNLEKYCCSQHALCFPIVEGLLCGKEIGFTLSRF